jgi:hypothetical protein
MASAGSSAYGECMYTERLQATEPPDYRWHQYWTDQAQHSPGQGALNNTGSPGKVDTDLALTP